VPGGFPLGHEKPKREGLSLRGARLGLLLREPEAGPVVLGRLAPRHRRLALLLQLLGIAVAAVGSPLGQEPQGRLRVTGQALALEIGGVRASHLAALLPAKAEPIHALADSA